MVSAPMDAQCALRRWTCGGNQLRACGLGQLDGDGVHAGGAQFSTVSLA
jgi:hypothetical protein